MSQVRANSITNAAGTGAPDFPNGLGVASFPDGTAAAPSITNTGDTNTGIYFPAADQVGIAANGVQQVLVTTSGPILNGQLTISSTGGQLLAMSKPDYSTGFSAVELVSDGRLRFTILNAAFATGSFELSASLYTNGSVGTSGQVLTSGGSGAAPSWKDSLTFSSNPATTSGTFFDFTGIPSHVREIEVYWQNVRVSDASDPAVQLIVGGSPIASGYQSSSSSSGADSTQTTGFHMYNDQTARYFSGIMRLVRAASGVWSETHSIALGGADASGGGWISGVGVVDGIRVTRIGAGTFIQGNVSISYR